MRFDRSALLAAALFLGIFVSGGVVGGAVVWGLAGDRGPPHGHPPRGDHGPGRDHGPPTPDRVVDLLNDELDLDDAQRAAITSIVRDNARAIDRAFADSETRMRAVLRSDQLARFDAFVARRKEKMPGFDGGPPGRGLDDGHRPPPDDEPRDGPPPPR